MNLRLLDTNVCIAFLNGRDPEVPRRLLALSPADVAVCSVVKAELLYGARHSARVEANLERLERFFAPLASLPFDDEAASWYGILRSQLERDGAPIGGNDLMIAAIARAHDATLVTRDQREFARVPGLRHEAW